MFFILEDSKSSASHNTSCGGNNTNVFRIRERKKEGKRKRRNKRGKNIF